MWELIAIQSKILDKVSKIRSIVQKIEMDEYYIWLNLEYSSLQTELSLLLKEEVARLPTEEGNKELLAASIFSSKVTLRFLDYKLHKFENFKQEMDKSNENNE